MKKILYIGIFSDSNLGDLVISNNIYNYFKNKPNISIDCMDFNNLKKIDYVTKDVLVYSPPNMTKKIKTVLSKNKIIRSIYCKSFEVLASNDYFKLFQEFNVIVDQYDIICIGGGNLLMSISNSRWAVKINKLVKIAKKRNKKILILSVGAGPILLENSKRLLKEALEYADYITVRDEYSKHILENELKINQKIEISGDPVLLLNDETSIKTKENKDCINIAISVMPFGKKSFLNLPHYKNSKYYTDMYKNLIEYFYSKNNNHIFHLFSTDLSDYDSILELYNYILQNSNCITKRNLKIKFIKSLIDLLKFYKTQDLLIGTRMHSLIIGFTQSLPIIAISWQDKIDAFMKYIDLLQYCYQLNTVNENISEIYSNSQQLLCCNTQYNEKNLIDIKKRYDHVITHFLETVPE